MVCLDIDECRRGDLSKCHDEYGICTNNVGSYECDCISGYTGDGIFCDDVDECFDDTDGCSDVGICHNTPGSYYCSCPDGFTGNGVICDDVDECLGVNHNCDAFATCHNDHGIYTCECNQGYIGNGIFCDDIDECITGDHNCPLKTVCKNNDGSFNCDCDIGYKSGDADESCEDGICVGNCVDVDECVARIDTCHDRTECANTDGRIGFKIGDILACNTWSLFWTHQNATLDLSYLLISIFETQQVTNVTAKLVTKKTLMVTAKMLTNVLMVSMHNVMRMPDALILLVAFVVNVMMDMPVME